MYGVQGYPSSQTVVESVWTPTTPLCSYHNHSRLLPRSRRARREQQRRRNLSVGYACLLSDWCKILGIPDSNKIPFYIVSPHIVLAQSGQRVYYLLGLGYIGQRRSCLTGEGLTALWAMEVIFDNLFNSGSLTGADLPKYVLIRTYGKTSPPNYHWLPSRMPDFRRIMEPESLTGYRYLH
ncbi:hypothetical protein BD779DRAFT_1528587 [Infundibulicybe gibba]|nr:hypothetical protein BD779DRAFT_1528587 [Infundibulicybe gibba]